MGDESRSAADKATLRRHVVRAINNLAGKEMKDSAKAELAADAQSCAQHSESGASTFSKYTSPTLLPTKNRGIQECTATQHVECLCLMILRSSLLCVYLISRCSGVYSLCSALRVRRKHFFQARSSC